MGIDRSIRSNIAQIHHLIHSYHFIFFYLHYNWNITSFDYNNN